jgi:hypothetical protein
MNKRRVNTLQILKTLKVDLAVGFFRENLYIGEEEEEEVKTRFSS